MLHGMEFAVQLSVRVPLMPKGVEHSWPVFARLTMLLVRVPLMPKGVEH